jgi:hypothetical protein
VRKFAFLTAVLIGSLLISGVCGAQSDSSIMTGAAAGSTGAAESSAQPSSMPAGGSGAAGGGAAVVAEPAVAEQSPAPAQNGRWFASKVGVGVTASLLGFGFEGAIPLTYHTNLRAGFNMFSYSRGFTNDGTSYAASLSFRSFETHFDWLPFAGSFHLSPGLMLYNGNQIKANASVPAGNTFTLGGTTYTSEAGDPITGTGKIGFNSVAPELAFGWGNLIPRKDSHFSVPFELGVLFQGSPKAALNLTGTACDSTGANCQNVAGDSAFQSNVTAQQTKLNNDMSFFKMYPIISLGFGYKF